MTAETTELARRLQEIRTATGKSLKELERVTSASDSALSRYFSGAACPPWSVVESLCRSADRDPEELRTAWERSRRSKLERYQPRATPPEGSMPSPAEEVDGADTAGGGSSDPGTVADDTAPQRKPRLRRRSTWIAVAATTAVCVAGVAGVTFASRPTNDHVLRLCPWRYVVTDGDPAPVMISDQPGANRKHLVKTYAPDEVFYVPEPPQIVNAMLHTVDGWVTEGDWIVRADGPCLTRPATGR